MELCGEQAFINIDISQASDKALVQQQWLKHPLM
jgi:hypothetical protein